MENTQQFKNDLSRPDAGLCTIPPIKQSAIEDDLYSIKEKI